jgi:hypothetical protein
MKIGKQEIDNNLIFLLLGLFLTYKLVNKISSGVSTIFGGNPEDKEKGEKLEKEIELAGYSPLAPQYHKNILKKLSDKEVRFLISKTPWGMHPKIAREILDLLTGFYISDDDANKIIRLIDTFETRYFVSQFADLYPKYAKGNDLEADIKKYLDADEIAELFKRINKKPIK